MVALEFIMAGATGIAVGTANFRNPYVMLEIIDGLQKYMEENNIEDLQISVISVTFGVSFIDMGK